MRKSEKLDKQVSILFKKISKEIEKSKNIDITRWDFYKKYKELEKIVEEYTEKLEYGGKLFLLEMSFIL